MKLSHEEKQRRKAIKRQYLNHEHAPGPAGLSASFSLDLRNPVQGTSFFQSDGHTYIDHTTIDNEKAAPRFRPMAD